MAGDRSRCMACRTESVEEFLDIGTIPVANNFVPANKLGDPEPAYPLRVGYCHNCSHCQLLDMVPPTELFDDYTYLSGVSVTISEYLRGIASGLVDRYSLGPDDLAIDVGSNDGTLLTGYLSHNIKVLGVEPAKNLLEISKAAGVETVCDYFGLKTAREVLEKYGQASVITSVNNFAHVPDPHDFVQGVDALLKEGGVFVVEIHYLMKMIQDGAFDTVYHEHMSYWGLIPMIALFEQYNMHAIRAKVLDIHHGQLRVYVSRKDELQPDETVAAVVDHEREVGIPGWESCRELAENARSARTVLLNLIDKLIGEGATIGGYGATAKGNTLLSFLGIGPERLKFIADRNTIKQGTYTPGHHIPVVSPDRIMVDKPDYLLNLAWNLTDEIAEQQSEYLKQGGHLIVPIPEVTVI